MIPTVKLICSSFSSVIATMQACMRLAVTSQCVKSPMTPFPYGECGWDYADDTSGKLLNNTLE